MPTLDQLISVANRERATVHNISTFNAGQKVKILSPDMTEKCSAEIEHASKPLLVNDPGCITFKEKLPDSVFAGDFIVVSD
jgi:hypothetical protein